MNAREVIRRNGLSPIVWDAIQEGDYIIVKHRLTGEIRVLTK